MSFAQNGQEDKRLKAADPPALPPRYRDLYSISSIMILSTPARLTVCPCLSPTRLTQANES
ncbi:hypothetical protein EMIT0232MI5_20099 [Pseudomonas sp. IT-232MI5]